MNDNNPDEYQKNMIISIEERLLVMLSTLPDKDERRSGLSLAIKLIQPDGWELLAPAWIKKFRKARTPWNPEG